MAVVDQDVTPCIVQGIGDLDAGTCQRLASRTRVAWDIETTGLDLTTDKICTVQIYDGETVVLVNRLANRPARLIALLEHAQTQKLFHHAMFDLRFMAAAWGATPRNVACTKIAAKLLEIAKPEQSLRPLLERYLGVSIDKSLQTSAWSSAHLRSEQVRYAASDVLHLEELADRLQAELTGIGREELAVACFQHIPARVQLDLASLPDVFVY